MDDEKKQKNALFPLMKLQLRLAHQTLTDWSSFCREVTYDAMVVRKVKLGGYGHTVDVVIKNKLYKFV